MSILHRKYIPIVVAILAFVFVICISLFFFVCIKHRPIESALFPLFFISVFTFSILAISLSLFSIISRWRNKSCTRFQFVRICKDMPNSWNLGVLLFCIVVFSWLVFLACVFFYDRENLYDWFHSVLFPLPVTLLPFFLTIILCRFSISYCKNKFVQPIRTDGPASHMAKYNTPIFFADCSTPITLKYVNTVSSNFSLKNTNKLTQNGTLLNNLIKDTSVINANFRKSGKIHLKYS